MSYKKQRLSHRLLAADSAARYQDVHVAFGGTGAVGGTALLEMLSLYEELMATHPPPPDAVPVLVCTGRTEKELKGFRDRLFRYVESRHGQALKPEKVRDGYLTHSGVFFVLKELEVSPLPGLDVIAQAPPESREKLLADFLHSIGVEGKPRGDSVVNALLAYIKNQRSFGGFLRQYRDAHFADRGRDFRFRSVILGVPLPSLMAYHQVNLELIAKMTGIPVEKQTLLKDRFVEAVRDDLAEVQASLADAVLVAHTTSVGGMYDEVVTPNGKTERRIRLGFAHSAQDDRLIEKQRFAEKLTTLYAEKGVRMLITAAAIGVDEVRVRETIPVHKKVAQLLADAVPADEELFPGCRRDPRVHVFPPLAVPLGDASDRPVRFTKQRTGDELRPTYTIRSGENGLFSVANADALYRVMRVASASELGLVLATVGVLGEDPLSPWFRDNVCYYTETDNARQVFDFLYQPSLLSSQLSGLEPLALQDLGSSKHQGELHTLAILILLHRLRTLDIDALPPYVDAKRFDARAFFEQNSRPLTFEDLDSWEAEATARDLAVMISADRAEDLDVLRPFRLRSHDTLFPAKQAARRLIFELVLHAVRTPPALGSPYIYTKDGKDWFRVGYFVAPLDLIVTRENAVDAWFKEHHAASGNPCSFDEFRDYHVCADGFLDVRPHAIVTFAKSDREDLRTRVWRAGNEDDLRTALSRVPRFERFSTCGVVALLFRLRALYAQLKEAMVELGTLQAFRWQMPRDANGHILVVPGAVEAMRLVSEGLEKTTGTEALDGTWGYERPNIPDRRSGIPMPSRTDR